jgi:CDP-paratose 2-epimerase
MPKWLITGGAGFIGANVTAALLERGDEVFLLDNLSRATAPINLEWLRERAGADLGFERVDVREGDAVLDVFRARGPFDVVLHLAGQVAVTTSVQDPRADLEANVLGSFNVLEATRRCSPDAVYLNASTNKVYGQLEHHRIVEEPTRYVDADAPAGVAETQPLDPHSPYGCSKAAADVYTLDYARIFGLRAISVRQSCIYGPRQFGVEDQGWVAWFALAARLGLPLTIFGTGKQVRDLLHVDDLLDLYLRLVENADRCAGRAYNAGGGPASSLSLLELLDRLGDWTGARVDPPREPARPGDQLVFVADTARALADVGWRPEIALDAGLAELLAWIDEHAAAAAPVLRPA